MRSSVTARFDCGRDETYISWTHNATDLLHGVQVGTEPTVHCKDLFVNDSCDRQAIETISECLPQFYIVAPFAFVVKTIYSIDRCAFVVTAQDEEVLRILDLVSQEETNSLQRLFSSIDIVT